MNFAPELLFAVFTQIITAAGVYAAIRADLARAIERATHAELTANSAHNRIDTLIMKGQQ